MASCHLLLGNLCSRRLLKVIAEERTRRATEIRDGRPGVSGPSRTPFHFASYFQAPDTASCLEKLASHALIPPRHIPLNKEPQQCVDLIIPPSHGSHLKCLLYLDHPLFRSLLFISRRIDYNIINDIVILLSLPLHQ